MNRQQNIDLPFAEFLRTWWYMPFTFWKETFENFFHPQLFLGCNIEDMDDEYNVLNEVGSYGKQISEIQKVLEVFIAHKPENLMEGEKNALNEYCAYTMRVAAALAESRGPQANELTTGYIDRLGDALQAKRSTDKEQFARVWTALKLLVEGDAGVKPSEVAPTLLKQEGVTTANGQR